MKSFCPFVFATLFALVAAANVNTQTHHLKLGEFHTGDRLLIRKRVHSSASLLVVARGEFEFNQNDVEAPATITYVIAYDQSPFFEGGFASLTEGGPGFDYVKLNFVSQWFKGYDFSVDVYGK